MKKTKQLAFRGGSYSLIMTAIVLAIVIVVNICVSALPKTLTKYDISASKLYSITSNTKVVVNNLEDDVTIYWICQADKEDSILENLLEKYDSLSSHISVVKKNPDVYPTFVEKYTDETAANNSLVVECGDRFRYISYDDIYPTTTDASTYTSTSSFDGEGAITSAIDYVVTEDLPQVYSLTGHGEADLPETFNDQITKANMEVQSLSLLTVDAVPEDASCVMIYAPSSDISEEEKNLLEEYANNGGKLLVIAGPTEGAELTNLNSLLSAYGVTANEGIVMDGDRDHYAFSMPYILIPDMTSDTITDSLIEERYTPLVPIAGGLTVDESATNVTELLTTTSEAYSKLAGFDLTTYEKEDGDIDGPFSVAVSIATDGGGQIIWFASSAFLEDIYNSYSSGANVNLAMNALSSLVGEREAIAIRSKSLSYSYLTINASTGALLKTVMIGVLPVGYLLIGIVIIMRTRRKQNEAV